MGMILGDLWALLTDYFKCVVCVSMTDGWDGIHNYILQEGLCVVVW